MDKNLMALIKCTECGQDLSTDARVCPHCGKPSKPIVPVINQQYPKKDTWKAITGFTIVGLVFIGLYVGFNGIPLTLHQLGLRGIVQPAQTHSSGQQIPLQEVKNLGYDFYVGQIDTAGTVDITDDLKNQITKIAYNAQFPTSLLKTVPIIILNNLALTGDQYISVPAGNLKVPDLKPDFLSEGGIYAPFNNSSAVIFINKPIIGQGQLTEVLTHELGHVVGSTLTDQDWTKFYQLRGIPSDTPRQGTSWNLSPTEDFAEVYKNVFTGIAVRTYYGELMPLIGDTDLGSCMTVYMTAQSSYMPQSQVDQNDPNAWLNAMTHPPKIDYTAVAAETNADPKVQACRRNVMNNPSKYSSDWEWGTPYKSVVGPVTKSFIQSIADRLNK
jgi:hypothetical protein